MDKSVTLTVTICAESQDEAQKFANAVDDAIWAVPMPEGVGFIVSYEPGRPFSASEEAR